MKAGGSSGDWINWNYHIPASEVEIGTWGEIPATDWMPTSKKVAFKLASESWSWISYTYRKIGNQISLKPVGYKFDAPAPAPAPAHASLLQMNDTKPATDTDASPKSKNGSITLAQKSSRKHKDQPLDTKRRATLFIEVENHGTAAQIHDDEMLIISNVKYEVPPEKTNTKY